MSVAKAGLMTTLHTRAAVFGTCNPGKNQRWVGLRHPLRLLPATHAKLSKDLQHQSLIFPAWTFFLISAPPAVACRYNPRVPLTSQLNISGPLLSRFDIVVLLLDQMSPEWDEVVANHILHTHHRRGGAGASSGNGGAGGSNGSQQQQQQQQADAAKVSYAWCVAIF